VGSVMFIRDRLGIESRPRPGHRYLVYGRDYHPPDVVMASPGHGAVPLERAAGDLAFLESLVPEARGGTLMGVVRLKAPAGPGSTGAVTPLAHTHLTLSDGTRSADVVTGPDGRFAAAVPAGTYAITPPLPDELVVWDPTSVIQARVSDGGCASVAINAKFNGRVRGVLNGSDGKPLATRVDLIPMDVAPDEVGHIRGMGSVSSNLNGEFEFAGVPEGRYLLGVHLYGPLPAYAPAYPRTYFPGTTDPGSAMPVVVERGRASVGHDFAVGPALASGEVEVVVEGSHDGALTVCVVPLDSTPLIWSERAAIARVPMRVRVVEGQRYDVHAHVDKDRAGHLESEAVVFTATAGTMLVRLSPDAPRRLHR
jgi:hypothetical protein